jgi:peptidoglycan/LPS O-acetylase OafA/YrhL
VKQGAHIGVLDGWRGASILLVLAAHLLPIGPKSWDLNFAVGLMGMVIFFTLSGFLITSILLTEVTVPEFLTRRFFRVLPLAWLYLAIAVFVTDQSPPGGWWSHFFFYANLPPEDFVPITGHIWSLCVELQFYVAIAVWYGLTGKRGLLILPLVALAFTGLRAWNSVDAVVATWYRIDEILAGCILALAWHGRLGPAILIWIKKIPAWLLIILLAISCLHIGKLYLLRPYFAALLVATTLLNPDTRLAKLLNVRPLVFIAGISYALYVIHPMLAYSWLGTGAPLEKGVKRILLFVILFALAYLSTRFYEKKWMAVGKTLAQKFKKPAVSQGPVV